MIRDVLGSLCCAVGLMLVLAPSAYGQQRVEAMSVASDDCQQLMASELRPVAKWRAELEGVIDFVADDCGGVGDYRVHIIGIDLRYGVALAYQGHEIGGLVREPGFHNPYGPGVDDDSLVWWVFDDIAANPIALIFQLVSQSPDPDGRLEAKYHIVSLRGRDSCLVAITNSTLGFESALALVEASNLRDCLE